MKRSRLAHWGFAGLCWRWRFHSATAMSAMPMGAPGCPELACCTASMAKARIALAIIGVLAMGEWFREECSKDARDFTDVDCHCSPRDLIAPVWPKVSLAARAATR